ncbi:MAG: helix-turn-helix transcriptional regulator, partial [Cyanobacteria bacterium P01_F01_bin.4]
IFPALSMNAPSNPDYTRELRDLMQSAGVLSFRALAERAGVSRWQVDRLRRGQLAQMRLEILLRLAGILQISLGELLSAFGIVSSDRAVGESATDQIEAVRKEYGRLQQQMAQQAEQLRSQFQSDALQTIESWLVQWPTAAHAAGKNDQIPAKRLLPLVKPVEKLLENWEVVAISAVGDEIPYDPQLHQLMDGSATPGDRVRVRYVGYQRRGKLMHRAKVSLVR